MRHPALVALALALVPTSASATWSIVAVDPVTQEVGVAVATCVEGPIGTQVLPTVPALAPGIGALAAQAYLDPTYRDHALMLLASGASAQDVIDMTNAIDFGAQTRQYGVVRLAGDTATFTGTQADEWKGDLQSTNVTVQGNILYGPEVVGDALAAFEAVPRECPWTLADRLMVALEAGSAQGGDNRCSAEQSALVAALQVAVPTDVKSDYTIDLLIPSQPRGGENPVVLLRAAYDEWRAMNPPDDAGCMMPGDSSSGGGDGSSSTATADASTSTTADSTSSGGTTTAPDPPASESTSTAGPSDGTTSDAAASESGGGCSCRTTGSPASTSFVLLPFVVLAATRAIDTSRRS